MCIEPLDRIEVPWTSNFENNLIFCIFHHILSTRLSCNMAGSPESFLASVEKGLDEDANTGEPGEREEADREAALDLVSILAHAQYFARLDRSIQRTQQSRDVDACRRVHLSDGGCNKRTRTGNGRAIQRRCGREDSGEEAEEKGIKEADEWQREKQRQGTSSPGDAVVGMLQKVAEYQRNDSVAEGTFAGVVPLCGVPEENATLANDGIVPSMQAMYGMTVSPAACATNPKTPLWSIQSPGSEGEERQRPRS